MADIGTPERTREGIQRLLTAPSDLKQCGAPTWTPKPLRGATDSHVALFREYCDEIDLVSLVALEWWEETLEARKRSTDYDQLAVRRGWMDRPAGPASFPGLVALVRDFWLACHDLNKQSSVEQRVPPESFLLGWLIEEGNHQQSVDVLACMPYWPIGLNRDGNWV